MRKSYKVACKDNAMYYYPLKTEQHDLQKQQLLCTNQGPPVQRCASGTDRHTGSVALTKACSSLYSTGSALDDPSCTQEDKGRPMVRSGYPKIAPGSQAMRGHVVDPNLGPGTDLTNPSSSTCLLRDFMHIPHPLQPSASSSSKWKVTVLSL